MPDPDLSCQEQERVSFIRLAEVPSTNSYAMDQLLRGFICKPTAFLADKQTAGKGRSGGWVDPEGNLALSLAFIETGSPATLPQLSFLAALAVRDGLQEVIPEIRSSLEIKWPNDLLLNEAKVCGILIESSYHASGQAVVVGWGVNCQSHPSGTRWPATDLAAWGGWALRDRLSEAIIRTWGYWYKVWQKGEGFNRVRDAWKASAFGLGRRVYVERAGELIEGFIAGISAEGALQLDSDKGERLTLFAGEVRLMLPT